MTGDKHRKTWREFERQFSGPLTPGQQAILELLVDGMTNLNIAAHLGIHEDTVKKQMQYIFHKYNVNSRLELAITVLRHRHAKEIKALRLEYTNKLLELLPEGKETHAA